MHLSDELAKEKVQQWVEIFDVDTFYKIYVKVNNVPDQSLKKRWRKCQAFIKVDSAYGGVSLVLNAYNFERDELDEVIAHELGHIVLDDIDELLTELLGRQLRKNVTKIIERTNERFARALARAKKGK
jgi:Zn-dependent peptidase ImmA (M78 family)